MTIKLGNPLRLDPGALALALDGVQQIERDGNYRLGGAATTRVEGLLHRALDLDPDWEVAAVRSGTDALVRGLQLLDIGPGDKVAIPDQTFEAVPAVVMTVGATPVVVDIDAETWCMDPDALAGALAADETIAAVIGVDNFGTPCDRAGLGAVCRSAGVPFVLDACESLGATAADGSPSAHADLVAVSFSFTKPIHAAGMGGALAGPADVMAQYWARPDLLARQIRLPEINAVFLECAWPQRFAALDRLRSIYATYISAAERLGLGVQQERGTSTRLHAPLLIDGGGRRDALVNALAERDIESRAMFGSMSAMFDLGPRPPVAARIVDAVVCLPSGSGLPFGAEHLVVEGLTDALAAVDGS